MNSVSTKKETVAFSTRGQIVIPRKLRRKFAIQQGTRAMVYEENDRIVIRPMTRQYLRSMRGALKGTGVLKALEEDRKREKEL